MQFNPIQVSLVAMTNNATISVVPNGKDNVHPLVEIVLISILMHKAMQYRFIQPLTTTAQSIKSQINLISCLTKTKVKNNTILLIGL